MITRITTQDAIITEYNNISSSYKISSLDRNNFHQFINGLYQAQGTTGVYFTKEDKLTVKFYFSMSQYYSVEALKVFLSLQKILKVGSVILEFDAGGIPYIRYVVSNTRDIILKVFPYFSLLYGKKRIDQYIMRKIYKLQIKISKGVKLNIIEKSELIHLVYSTYTKGQGPKLTLREKLEIFRGSSLSYVSEEIEKNKNLASKFFIMGLFLINGNFKFVFNPPLGITPEFTLEIIFTFKAESATESNIELLELVAKSLNLETKIYKRKSGTIELEYRGTTVFDIIIPFLLEHKNWLYWINIRIANILEAVEIIKSKDHFTNNGRKKIVNLLYNLPIVRGIYKQFWMDLIEKGFSTK